MVSLGIFFTVPPTEPCALRSTQPLKVSTRDFSWGKGGRCVWLTTYHPCSAERSRKSGTLIYPEPLGPPRPVAGHLYFTSHIPSRYMNCFSIQCISFRVPYNNGSSAFRGHLFSKMSRPAVGPTLSHNQRLISCFCVVNRPGCEADHSPYLIPTLRIRGAVPPFLHPLHRDNSTFIYSPVNGSENIPRILCNNCTACR